MGRMKDMYMDLQDEAFRESEIEAEIAWRESDCVKQGCSNARENRSPEPFLVKYVEEVI